MYEISQQNVYAKTKEKPCQMRIANFDFCMALSIQSKKRNTINVKLERSENTSSINLYVVVLWPQTLLLTWHPTEKSFRWHFRKLVQNSVHTRHTHEPSGFHGFHLHSTLPPTTSNLLCCIELISSGFDSIVWRYDIHQIEKNASATELMFFHRKSSPFPLKSVWLCLFFVSGVRTLCNFSKKRTKKFLEKKEFPS